MPLSPRTSNRIFVGCLTALGALGMALGYTLSERIHLETFKLLNIVGLSYDLLGILVLSEIVAQSEGLKKFFVKWVAGSLIWGQMVIPLGSFIAAFLAAAFASAAFPSAALVAKFSASFFGYSILLLAFIEATVFFPRLPRFQSLEIRSRTFGLTLLVSGIIVQLIAAVQDLNA